MTAPEIARWSNEEMVRLAASGVAKVDLLGPRGTTLCSMDEIAAMAAVCALNGVGPRLLSTPHSTGDDNV
ncbi:hypothetical protein SAMN05443999_101234 [Roseovarius azorensis]|uniref:Uncharacterized protein n=1 Tax=Roseovarius azorensis TaxID=1287727 RepID=A0A1H7G5R3_9RHOB|nr:hypothetical protein [Roseovarius azorensis]SEK33468.1 hypothetical protein SAMN05443999_101234 [Roseovarius azorensis]